jgi:hypothetical protein
MICQRIPLELDGLTFDPRNDQVTCLERIFPEKG